MAKNESHSFSTSFVLALSGICAVGWGLTIRALVDARHDSEALGEIQEQIDQLRNDLTLTDQMGQEINAELNNHMRSTSDN